MNRPRKVTFHYNTGYVGGKESETIDLIDDYNYSQEELDEMTDEEFEKTITDDARTWFEEKVEWALKSM